MKLPVFFGKPGQWFEENDLDGDKNSIFHDLDGTVSGYPNTYVGRADNFLIQHPSCVNVSQWNGVICSGRYSQVHKLTAWALPRSWDLGVVYNRATIGKSNTEYQMNQVFGNYFVHLCNLINKEFFMAHG